ncbi:MAG: SusC/RagA family TonB-linked outer membrane protein [Flavobacteriaceae bacterium]|nr:SusC/RagA family TonB-linked outer membrane protein [Flavobacteriaceae bacterium]MCY4266474.1 SusC/RagA family TonB-linked outer membrane protein [Flavobacteriaceae bacterium]
MINNKTWLSYFWFIVCVVLLINSRSLGQIQGIVVDAETNQPLMGATVKPNKFPDLSAITDIDGKFAIQLNESQELIISFIGYKTQTVRVDSDAIETIFLEPDAMVMDAVVVTALGISRDEKSLGYAVQSIDQQVFENNTSVNVLGKLSGLVAGLNISPSGGGPAASNRVLIRGSSSLTGSDQPLFVIDGFIVNSEPGDNRATQDGGLDFGDPLSTINPDDIESVTVLKGPGATALYGSLGTNGVIVIETKKGREGKDLAIQISSSILWEQPYIFPKFQNEFGRGAQGVFTPLNTLSFGPQYDGRSITNWLGEQQNYQSVENQMKSFFRTGINHNHNLQLTASDDKNQFRLSASLYDLLSIMPNSDLNRKTASITYTRKFDKKWILTTKVNYFNQNVFNRPNLGGSPDNPVRNFYIMPRSVVLDDLQPYINEEGKVITWDGKTQGSFNQNPYWGINLNTNSDIRERLIGYLKLDFEIFPWLYGSGRAGWDYISDERENRTAENTVYKTSPVASFRYGISNRLISNYDLLLTTQREIGPIDFNLTSGISSIDTQFDSLSSNGDDMVNPNLWVINNFKEIESSQGIAQRRLNSVFSTLDLDWKNQLYANFTYRNDWNSVLPKENRSFAYWSSNFSWIATETLSQLPDFIDFLKLRASYAKVGNANSLSTSALFFTYTPSTGHLGQPFTRVPRIGPNSEIKPESTTAIELGLDLRLFGGRANIDFSWYRNDSTDQIFTAPVASTTGFENQWINSGSIRNEGFEFVLSGKPIEKPDVSWSINTNAALNTNEVLELTEELPILILGGSRAGISIQARSGQRSDLLVGSRYEKSESGQFVIDEFNLPAADIEEDGNSDFVLGQVQPDWLLGLNSTLNYKKMSLYVALDAQFGGIIYSSSYAVGSAVGTLEHTIEGRNGWYQSEQERTTLGYRPNEWIPTNGVRVEGVDEQGNPVQHYVNPQRYWSRLSGINEANVFDSSFVRLRELSVSFQLSNTMKKILPFNDFRISVFGSNLAYLLRHTEGFAPQSSLSSGKAQGIESFAFPELRNVGVRLNIGI